MWLKMKGKVMVLPVCKFCGSTMRLTIYEFPTGVMNYFYWCNGSTGLVKCRYAFEKVRLE